MVGPKKPSNVRAGTASSVSTAPLRTGPAGLGDVAALLGYADQAHVTRDFARVTSMTPGQFAARHVPDRERRPLRGGA